MHLRHTVVALPLIAAQFVCTAAQDDRPDIPQVQDDMIVTPPHTVEINQAPTQIAQYPGAPHEDRHGNLWFTTVLEGLIRYDGNEFVTFTTADGLGGNTIRHILEGEDGTLWFATTGGLTRYDGASFTTLTDYEPLIVKHRFGIQGDHLELWDVLLDRRGDLWIATMDGVFRYDGKLFSRFPMPVIALPEKSEFTPEMVYCIFEDQDGNIWFGTDGAGVVRYDGSEMVVYTMHANGLCSDNVCTILQDTRGDFWFGTSNGGVSHYDGTTFTTLLRNEEFSKHVGWGRFMGILEDRESKVWFGVAGAGGGVHRYDGHSFRYFSEKEGLGTGGVASIRQDRSGNVWLGSTSGVYRFDGEIFINFTKNDPLRESVPSNTEDDLAIEHEPERVALDGWVSETFALPPGFAPDLPAGTESLRFAPGWRDPSAEGFWSYAFVMWIDETVPDAARIDELLEHYYTGLMSAFGVGKDHGAGSEQAHVKVKRAGPNQFEATMHLIDGFATFKPIDLHVLVETAAESDERSIVRIQVSPQSKDHSIWQSLEAAIADIQLHDGALSTEKSDEATISLEVLKERSAYAALDRHAVETLARAAEVRWPGEFSGFTYERVEHFAAGRVSHWMSIWLHSKTGLEFVLVPGGTFRMGSPADEADRKDDELQHSVTLDPFLIARTECTWKAWDTVAAAVGLNRRGVGRSDELPVNGFSPADVDRWCVEASLALPTEAQWEYVCRAGTRTPWTMGGDKADLARFGNVGSAECPEDWMRMGLTESWRDGYGATPAEVGMFACNAFGVFDVHGNVCEWCRDNYSSYEIEVPAETRTGVRPGTSQDRIARGGNFGGAAAHARSAHRLNVGTGISPNGNKGFGFRPSLDLPF